MMYVVGWGVNINDFLHTALWWLEENKLDVTSYENLMSWEEFKKDKKYYKNDDAWSDMYSEIGDGQYELWFGGIQVYTEFD